MGPSAGGLTCSLALVRLLSTITDTLSATPWPNPAVSTPAATLNVGEGPLSVAGFEVSSCAAPALLSFEAPDKDKSGPLACERLSAAPAPAPAALETACAMLAAVAAVTADDVAADVAADACAKAAAGTPAGASGAAATPCGPASGSVESAALEVGSGIGALPCTIAAAMTACAGAAVALSVGSFTALLDVCDETDVWDEAGAIAPRLGSPSLGLASRALPWGAAGMRLDVAVDTGDPMVGACGTLKPGPGAAGLLTALPGAAPLPAAGALLPVTSAPPPGAETDAAARLRLGANAPVPPALAGRVGAAGIVLGAAPGAPPGEPVVAPAAPAAWAAAKSSAFTAGRGAKGSAGKDAGTGGGGLPGTGNALPLEEAFCSLLTALLRTGLPPASRRAPAKSWLATRAGGDAADAGVLSCAASSPLGAGEISGIAFIPLKLQATCQSGDSKHAYGVVVPDFAGLSAGDTLDEVCPSPIRLRPRLPRCWGLNRTATHVSSSPIVLSSSRTDGNAVSNLRQY